MCCFSNDKFENKKSVVRLKKKSFYKGFFFVYIPTPYNQLLTTGLASFFKPDADWHFCVQYFWRLTNKTQ